MLELKVLIFIYRVINFDLHIGLIMKKTAWISAPGLNIFLSGDDKAVKLCESCYLLQDLSYTADIASVWCGPNPYLFGVGCIDLKPDPGSLFLQQLKLLLHMGNRLGQQNQVICKVEVL